MAEDPEHRAELAAWDKYQNASLEARTMVRLNHDNVLRLLGITLTPMRLLLELAPLGDLKTCVEGFKSAGIRFNRRTLRAVMTQASFLSQPLLNFFFFKATRLLQCCVHVAQVVIACLVQT